MKTTYTLEQLENMLHSNNPYDRKICACQGYKLDILKDDKDGYVREEVARQGYALDQLIKDEDGWVVLTACLKRHALKEQAKDKARAEKIHQEVSEMIKHNPAFSNIDAKVRFIATDYQPCKAAMFIPADDLKEPAHIKCLQALSDAGLVYALTKIYDEDEKQNLLAVIFLRQADHKVAPTFNIINNVNITLL